MSAVVRKFPATKHEVIPMPDARAGGPRLYPWDTMDIGDSFAFPRGAKITSVGGQASSAGKKYGRKFAVRTMPDGTYRCWRTA